VTTDRHWADVNRQGYAITLSEGKVESARLLIQHEANVNVMDNDNQTALHLASSNGCAEIVQLLIQHGADVNTQDKRCSTPLHLALTVSAKTV
jgi:ankyrin repeat protein